MEKIILKEKAKKLYENSPGKVRGIVMKSDVKFIMRESGREGIEKMEKEMKDLGFPLKLEKISSMEFYPNGLRAIFLLSAKKALNMSDDKMRDMGRNVAKFSAILRLFIGSFLIDRKTFFDKAPSFWDKFVTVGKVNIEKIDEKKKTLTATLTGFDVDPVFCPYIEGIFSGFVKIAMGARKVECKEIKCTFKGDDRHEFVISWD